MSSRLSIRSMQYFLTAMDSGSLTQAAHEMNVAPSAISNGIDQVEAEFGLKLVQRFPAKGLQPTASGKTIVRRIRRMIEEYENLISGGKELRESLSGKLTVGYYAPVSPSFLPTIAAPLLQQNPEIRLQFVDCNNEEAQAGLLDGRFDLILFVAHNARPGIKSITLIEAPPYLLVSADHKFAARQFVTPDEISGQELVLLDLPFTAQYLRGLLDAHGINPRIVATASTSEMVRSLVGAGVGCSILNMQPLIEQTYGGNKVKAVPIKADTHILELSLSYVSEDTRRVVNTFAEACSAYFDGPQANKLVARI